MNAVAGNGAPGMGASIVILPEWGAVVVSVDAARTKIGVDGSGVLLVDEARVKAGVAGVTAGGAAGTAGGGASLIPVRST